GNSRAPSRRASNGPATRGARRLDSLRATSSDAVGHCVRLRASLMCVVHGSPVRATRRDRVKSRAQIAYRIRTRFAKVAHAREGLYRADSRIQVRGRDDLPAASIRHVAPAWLPAHEAHADGRDLIA